ESRRGAPRPARSRLYAREDLGRPPALARRPAAPDLVRAPGRPLPSRPRFAPPSGRATLGIRDSRRPPRDAGARRGRRRRRLLPYRLALAGGAPERAADRQCGRPGPSRKRRVPPRLVRLPRYRSGRTVLLRAVGVRLRKARSRDARREAAGAVRRCDP